MKILEIYIEEYGALCDKRVILDSGMNILVGENESGKSTLCAFIKFILYGHIDAKERELRTSILSGISAGYLRVSHSDGKIYRIERRETEAKSKPTVFCETDSAEIKKMNITPGEYFLGIPEKLYTRSLFISQKGEDRLDRQSSEAVMNLLSGGSESLNVKRAKNALDEYRKEYRLLRGRGGLIPETEDAISDIRARFKQSVEKKLRREELLAELKMLSEAKKASETEFSKVLAAEKGARASKIVSLAKERENAKERVSVLDNSKSELISNNTVNGVAPTREYISYVSELSRELNFASKNFDTVKSLEKPCPDMPKNYEKYASETKNALETSFLSLSKLKKRAFTLVFALLAFSALFFAGSIFSEILLIVGGIFAVAGIALIPRYLKKNTEFNNFCSETGCRNPQEIAFFGDRIENYREEFSTYSASIELTRNAENAFIEKEKELVEALKKFEFESVSEACKKCGEFFEKLDELKKESSALNAHIDVLDAYLSGVSDEEISEAKKFLSLECVDHNIAISRDPEMFKSEIEKADARLYELNMELARLDGETPTDASELFALEEALCKKLTDYERNFDAAKLALDALTEAERSVRSTFIPQISKLGGEYFSTLTGGRYSSLALDPDFDLSSSEGDSLPKHERYFSGGSYALAWFCLRLALAQKISDEPLPLILDEPFVYYDDRRLEAVMALLSRMAQERQIILFSASFLREERMQRSFDQF